MSTIEIAGLSKAYGSTPVLHAVDLTVPDGSITAVLGTSGSGKTTLLRVIAGFEDADTGSVSIAGRVVDDGRRTVRPQHRGVGYVPQDAALFPHLTVAGNIGFGVRRAARRELADLIDLVGLTGLERRLPAQLSGGQQQRVALARALAITPRVVLLDEPFGSLDAGLRETVRGEVVDILARSGTTTVLVTHDQDEALSVAHHIALLDDGRILAHGDPHELYAHPPNTRAATAIGVATIVPATVTAGQAVCFLGRLELPARHDQPHGSGARVEVVVRPEQITLLTDARPGLTGAVVAAVRFHGHDTLVDLVADTPGRETVVARTPGRALVQAGQRVWLCVDGPVHPLP